MRYGSYSSASGTSPTAQIGELLAGSPAFKNLDQQKQVELAQALEKINGFLGHEPGSPLARQMAPDLSPLLAGNNPPNGPAVAPPAPAPAAAPAPANTGPVGRAGEAARATLAAIDFPAFVGSLIQGTFQAIVDASIQQMEAYAELLKNVAGTVDRFMQDNISDGMARDWLADQYQGVFRRDTNGGMPRLSVISHRQESPLPSFFKDLGFASTSDLDEDAIEQVVIPAARRQLAESRQRTLATMVLMGINRVVVDDGEITAKLQFHIDARESMQMRFDQTKTTGGNMSGYAGRSPFGAQSVMVNTASLNAQTDLNVRADLTGQVRVKFRSETFPLERFADSAAIQLINTNAQVPLAPPKSGAPAVTPPAPVTPAVAGEKPVGNAAATPVSQGLAFEEWAPVG